MTGKRQEVVILVRQEDGSWKSDGERYSLPSAKKICQFNRIIGGIQSRPFPANEYVPPEEQP